MLGQVITLFPRSALPSTANVERSTLEGYGVGKEQIPVSVYFRGAQAHVRMARSRGAGELSKKGSTGLIGECWGHTRVHRSCGLFFARSLLLFSPFVSMICPSTSSPSLRPRKLSLTTRHPLFSALSPVPCPLPPFCATDCFLTRPLLTDLYRSSLSLVPSSVNRVTSILTSPVSSFALHPVPCPRHSYV